METFNNEALKLAAMGVTVLVSSGDDGAASDAQLCNRGSGSDIIDYWEVSKGYLVVYSLLRYFRY